MKAMRTIANHEAERALLGSVLIHGDAILEVLDVQRDDFDRAAHRVIWSSMLELARARTAIDAVTVAASLKTRGELDLAGGPAVIASLSVAVPTAANAKHYAGEVRSCARRRTFSATAIELATEAASATDSQAFLAEAFGKLLALASPEAAPDTFLAASEWARRCYDDLEQRAKTRDPPALEGGVFGVDRACALRPGALVVIAALTSVGKSALAGQVALGVAERGGYVVVASLEMTISQLTRRFVASRANVDMQRLDRPHELELDDWNRVNEALRKMSELHLSLWTPRGLTIEVLRMRALREHALRPLRLLIVDYLQLMRGEGDTRATEVGSISSGLKLLAGELDIPVLALAQLNREAARRDGPPQLSDLRDSGSIEQDADCVGFIYREDKSETDVVLRFAKNRHGPLSETKMVFDGARQRFED